MYMLQFEKQNKTEQKPIFENIYCYTVIINVEYKYIGNIPKTYGLFSRMFSNYLRLFRVKCHILFPLFNCNSQNHKIMSISVFLEFLT